MKPYYAKETYFDVLSKAKCPEGVLSLLCAGSFADDRRARKRFYAVAGRKKYAAFADDVLICENLPFKIKYYEEQHIALICAGEGFAPEQFKVMLSEAKSNGYAVIVAINEAFEKRNFIKCSFNSLWKDTGREKRECIAQAVDSFMHSGGKFICYLSGGDINAHVATLADYPGQLCISPGMAAEGKIKSDTDRNASKESRDLFDFIFFDTCNNLVKIVRYGANINMYMQYAGFISLDFEKCKVCSQGSVETEPREAVLAMRKISYPWNEFKDKPYKAAFTLVHYDSVDGIDKKTASFNDLCDLYLHADIRNNAVFVFEDNVNEIMTVCLNTEDKDAVLFFKDALEKAKQNNNVVLAAVSSLPQNTKTLDVKFSQDKSEEVGSSFFDEELLNAAQEFKNEGGFFAGFLAGGTEFPRICCAEKYPGILFCCPGRKDRFSVVMIDRIAGQIRIAGVGNIFNDRLEKATSFTASYVTGDIL